MTIEDPEVEKILQRRVRKLLQRRAEEVVKEREGGYAPLNLSDRSFGDAVRSKPLAIVDFWAEWCGPCRIMLPVFERLAGRYGDRVVFGRVNVDEYSGLASRYGVYSIPTFIVFHSGAEADRLVGAVGEQGLERLVLKHLHGG